MKNISVGLLFPRSAVYPAIGFDVVDAFRKGMEHFGAGSTNIITESVGIGGNEKETGTLVERMLLRENVDIVVAYIDHYAAEVIEPLFNAANRLLIVIEPGGTIPKNWSASPLRLHMTLDNAYGNYIAASMAIKAGVTNAAFCSTFYDAGYLSCSALVERFIEQGGQMAYNSIVPFKYEDFDIRPLTEAIDSYNINGVLSHMSIESGAVFLKAYAAAGLPAKVPSFFTSPFTFEEQFLDKLPFPFAGIKGCVPWSRSLQNDANAAFMQAMDEEYGKQGNCFSSLAWDAAHFTAMAVKAMEQTKGNATKAMAAMGDVSFDSTRGAMQLDKRTHYFTAPLYSAEIVEGDNGMSKVVVGDTINTPDEWNAFSSREMPETGISRWLNTYLCTT